MPASGEGRPLFDFAYVHHIDERLQELSRIAEYEDWSYHFSEATHPNPILYYYFHTTYERLKEQGKITETEDSNLCSFNTGLCTELQEPIYALFSKNKEVGREPWRFVKFSRKGEYELTPFVKLPEMATYFDDPSCLVFDSRLEWRVNYEHILTENRERFPEPFRSMDDYSLQILLHGSIESAKERVKRNYKIAVPQYYHGYIQILMPICLSNPKKADLALSIQRHEGCYRGATCLTLDMAYNNARQLAKPDRDWLQP
jgi:hypothetical protein